MRYAKKTVRGNDISHPAPLQFLNLQAFSK